MSGDWYTLGRRVLAAWQAAGRAAAEGARTAPLTRALDCVDAADALVKDLGSPDEQIDPRRSDLVAAYLKARGAQ